MKVLLTFIKKQTILIVAVLIGSVIGGATTALVMAAIPDSDGQINGCYKSSTMILRVTDPAGNCASNETSLSWSQGPRAYAHILANGILDTTRSKNISAVTTVFNPILQQNVYCVDTAVSVKTINVSNEDYLDDTIVSVDTSSAAWSNITADLCPSGTDAATTAGFPPQGLYISFN